MASCEAVFLFLVIARAGADNDPQGDGGSSEMAGNQSRPRESQAPGNARDKKTVGNRRDHPLAPFLAIVGASLPWLVYDSLIKNPEEFWTVKGWIVLAAVALGVVLLGISWHFTQSPPHRDG